jgi:hypothetical protein
MVEIQVIQNKIYEIRGQRVMLDRDLAELYRVTTGNLNKAAKRNIERFPERYMFQLDKTEFENLIFQNGTSSWGGVRKMPYAFTEQGVSMLSAALGLEPVALVNMQTRYNMQTARKDKALAARLAKIRQMAAM